MFDIDPKSAYKDDVFHIYHNGHLLEVHNKSKNNWQDIKTFSLIPKAESVLIDYVDPFKNFTGTVKSSELPSWAKFVAQDSDGKIHAFEEYPKTGGYIWYTEGGDNYLVSFVYNSNWKQSITTIEAIKRFEGFTTIEEKPERLKHDPNAFKVGDVVRIVRKVEKADGWGNVWVDEMSSYIGQNGVIDGWSDDGIYLRGLTFFAFPSCALELVEENPNKREESSPVECKNSENPQDREDVSHLKKGEDADSIVEELCQTLKSRSEVGIKKYGVTLDRTDLTPVEWCVHAEQEILDLLLYLKRLKRDLQKVESLFKPS